MQTSSSALSIWSAHCVLIWKFRNFSNIKHCYWACLHLSLFCSGFWLAFTRFSKWRKLVVWRWLGVYLWNNHQQQQQRYVDSYAYSRQFIFLKFAVKRWFSRVALHVRNYLYLHIPDTLLMFLKWCLGYVYCNIFKRVIFSYS